MKQRAARVPFLSVARRRAVARAAALLLTSLILIAFVALQHAGAQQVVWSKQFGTSSSEAATAIALDGQGAVYVVGATCGALFSANAGRRDVFAIKYNSAGDVLWDTQFGSDQDDVPYSAATDAAGNLYVAGITDGSLYSASAGGDDAFVLKLSPQGEVLWGRQFGTDEYDFAWGIAVDAQRSALYVVGETPGDLFGTNPASIPTSDLFVVKFDLAGTQLWAHQMGTAHDDIPQSAAADGEGGVYVAGSTLDLFDSGLGGYDAFVARLTADGSVTWGRQFGTSVGDMAGAVRTHSAAGVYVAGAMGEAGEVSGPDAAFVARYDTTGTQQWLRQLNTSRTNDEEEYSGLDTACDLAADAQGNVFMVGNTGGNLFGANAGSLDMYLVKYDPQGNQVLGYQFGTAAEDGATGLAAGAAAIYVVGGTDGSLYGDSAGEEDAFVVKFTP